MSETRQQNTNKLARRCSPEHLAQYETSIQMQIEASVLLFEASKPTRILISPKMKVSLAQNPLTTPSMTISYMQYPLG